MPWPYLLPYSIAGVEQWLLTELEGKNGVNNFCRLESSPKQPLLLVGILIMMIFLVVLPLNYFMPPPLPTKDRSDEVF
jgi:hypothetical protein